MTAGPALRTMEANITEIVFSDNNGKMSCLQDSSFILHKRKSQWNVQEAPAILQGLEPV
jgi:hypothetical protein